ncbi:hypothetical protein SCA6_013516 [Theobroma cacao]
MEAWTLEVQSIEPNNFACHLSKALLRSESAPVNIPAPRLATSPALSCKQNLPPSPPVKVTKAGTSNDNIGPVQTGATIKKDDFDDSEFPCPFDVEDDDMTDPGSRPKSYDRRGHLSDPHETGLFMNRKSQDAAVGALVRMLKRAPPLRQDVSSSTNFSEASRPEIWSKSIQEQNQILEIIVI